jgi:hypothetical protein
LSGAKTNMSWICSGINGGQNQECALDDRKPNADTADIDRTQQSAIDDFIFSASDYTVKSGSAVKIYWSAGKQSTEHCVAEGNWTGNSSTVQSKVKPSGNVIIEKVTVDQSLSMTCFINGKAVKKTVNVKVQS